jgi:hypothetical protein
MAIITGVKSVQVLAPSQYQPNRSQREKQIDVIK